MSSEEFKEDKDMTIRPVSLDEYVGQSEIKENLGVFIKSSVMRGENFRSYFIIWSSWAW